MAAERGHLDLHERVERERTQDVVQLSRTIHVEDAEVGKFSHHPPQVKPLSLQLQLLRPLVLRDAKLPDLLRISPGRDMDLHIYLGQHTISPRRPKRHP